MQFRSSNYFAATPIILTPTNSARTNTKDNNTEMTEEKLEENEALTEDKDIDPEPMLIFYFESSCIDLIERLVCMHKKCDPLMSYYLAADTPHSSAVVIYRSACYFATRSSNAHSMTPAEVDPLISNVATVAVGIQSTATSPFQLRFASAKQILQWLKYIHSKRNHLWGSEHDDYIARLFVKVEFTLNFCKVITVMIVNNKN